ncbi:SCO family protein [Mesobacillus foraminis]|uniref:SCO family protein n=1 Tax=Mesobacillus foraminis TaxID=279826 RepID=UPI0039A30CD3
MKRYLNRITIMYFLVLLTGCGQDIEDPLNWKVAELEAINQEGEEVRLADLKGKVWIADFIFTNCATVCPPMTANMARLQERLKEKRLDAEIVSFSVDPGVDTPKILKDYISKYDADLSTWHMLTGYSQEFIEEYALKNFKTIVKKPDLDNQVLHGTSFYLIDKDGTIIKSYDGMDVPYEDIIEDVGILTNS